MKITEEEGKKGKVCLFYWKNLILIKSHNSVQQIKYIEKIGKPSIQAVYSFTWVVTLLKLSKSYIFFIF